MAMPASAETLPNPDKKDMTDSINAANAERQRQSGIYDQSNVNPGRPQAQGQAAVSQDAPQAKLGNKVDVVGNAEARGEKVTYRKKRRNDGLGFLDDVEIPGRVFNNVD